MYELEYVKKRKRRKWVLISAGVATVVVSSLSIVAFLGRHVGTFTVALNTGSVSLALSEYSDFRTKESFLRVNSISEFHEYSYSGLPADENLDNEQTDYMYGAVYDEQGANVESLNFFKYTFYVKNVGKIMAKYDIKLNITDNKPGDDGRTLDDTVRVMLYDNDAFSATHYSDVYAKRSATHHINKETGEVDFSEPISISEAEAKAMNIEYYGYSKIFESDRCILSKSVGAFAPGETRRYTVVYWLEGYDPQSNNYQAPPKGATLKLGVEVNAYES